MIPRDSSPDRRPAVALVLLPLLLATLATAEPAVARHATAGGPDAGPGLGDGWHLIEVEQPSGATDEVWIYAVSPGEGEQLPVLVYGHGLNTQVVNCYPEGGPDGFGEGNYGADRVAELYADLGIVSIAVFYRNRGTGAPPLGTVKLRDHFVLDARTLLAAARWGAEEHGRGSDRVALMGFSMGTWPAFWAVTSHPRLADLQAGLDLRTVILQGQSANHLNNVSMPGCFQDGDPDWLPLWSPDLSLQAHALDLGMSEEVAAADLAPGALLHEELSASVTELGIEIVVDQMFEPSDPAIPQCQKFPGLPPVCNKPCIEPSIIERVGHYPEWHEVLREPAARAVRAVCAAGPDALDPGPNHPNVNVRRLRDGSPSYAARGPLLAPRALSLFSTGDQHYSEAAQRRLLDKLEELGASVPDPPPNGGDDCRHSDYNGPAKPECGYDATVEELREALGLTP